MQHEAPRSEPHAQRRPPGQGEPIPHPREPIAGVLFPNFTETEWCENRIGDLQVGEAVVASGKRGLDLARVVRPRVALTPNLLVTGRILRRPTQQDIHQWHLCEMQAEEALRIVEDHVGSHALPMRMLKAHLSLDERYYTFFYRAPDRVDFRALVQELATYFRTRLELRQLGPREQAQLLGGVAPCGRVLCCTQYLREFCSVNAHMAKVQNLPLESGRSLGVCGRLKCCVHFEYDDYVSDNLADRPSRSALR